MIFRRNSNNYIEYNVRINPNTIYQNIRLKYHNYYVPPACQFHYKLMVLPRQPFSAVSGDQGVSLTSALTAH